MTNSTQPTDWTTREWHEVGELPAARMAYRAPESDADLDEFVASLLSMCFAGLETVRAVLDNADQDVDLPDSARALLEKFLDVPPGSTAKLSNAAAVLYMIPADPAKLPPMQDGQQAHGAFSIDFDSRPDRAPAPKIMGGLLTRLGQNWEKLDTLAADNPGDDVAVES